MLEDVSFQTNDKNIIIHVASISIKPNLHAIIEYRLSYKAGGSDVYKITIEGDDYKRWSNDDRYLFIYIANLHNLQYVERIEPEYIDRIYCLPNEDGSFKNIVEKKKNPLYTGLSPLIITQETLINKSEGEPLQIQSDDNRSVHNPNDLEQINNLQIELNDQKAKLDKILGLLGKNNLI